MALLLSLLFIFSLLTLSLSQPQPPKGFLIDCGATEKSTIDGREWLPDSNFVSGGSPRNLSVPVLVPTLSTVRSFPNDLHAKFCYVVPVYRGAKYMIRTTYFYGGINGKDSPPVFDQMVDGTLWGVVNTSDDYANGMSSYYEGVFVAQGKTMSLCLGSNTYTDSDPFISALEFVILGDSLYNSTNFSKHGMSLVARHSFGYNGSLIRYPDDQFDRFWEPFDSGVNYSVVASNRSMSVSSFWNLPPLKIFESELTSRKVQHVAFSWLTMPLPKSSYYIALYFADERNRSTRVFSVSINGFTFLSNLNVTPAGACVFAREWPLEGPANITLTPAVGSDIGPLINAGEIFDMLNLGRRTLTRDVIALEKVKGSLVNPPRNWNGDPWLPRPYSWTGIRCSEGPRVRVVSLNLTSMGLLGSLSPSISNMTGLTEILLGNNSLSGPIPDLSSLKLLEILHLEDNQFSGEIPPSLGDVNRLHELFLQNNNLTGQVPKSLEKPGLNLRTSGNKFLAPPPS